MASTNANKPGKQRQMAQSKELSTSFKNTANLAHALTRERVQIQNDLQKISAGKCLKKEFDCFDTSSNVVNVKGRSNLRPLKT